ncbi:amino acid ABC transporter substrate-binding protein [Mangrovitalea sediminis]|uniref:amino acid ABC transporter substrate-binding protein n=1 Tax=Mangrovitalea sediminis TaxID=1982043 RepID=UPI000BE529F9|nr:amino acid ABC transporter substrate-binding protein [Mangrovitalea sediminis]
MKKLALSLLISASLTAPAISYAKDIVIGFTTSETGKLNADSTPQLQGFELWRDQVNAAGGIKVGNDHYKVKFVKYDDQSTASRVQQLYVRLVTQDNANFLFSPYSSGLTATAAIISEQYGKVMITTGAAEGKTYELGNQYLFQMYTPANLYLASALDAVKAKDPGAKIALIYENGGFAKAVAKGAKQYAGKLGLNVVMDEAYDPSTTDFSPILNKVVTSGATVLIGGGHFADGSTLARQLHEQNMKLKMISLLVAPDVPKFVELGDAAYGVSVPSQWEPEVKFTPDFGPTAAQFTKEYKARYHVTPGYHAAGGYASGIVLEHAIEQAGSLDTDKVAAALNKMNATTFYGNIQFATDKSDHGLQIGHDMVLAQWQKDSQGKLGKQVVWPAAAGTAPLIYPISK